LPIGLKGNSDGSGAIQIGGSDAISISTGLNTTFAGTITATGTVAGTTGTLYPLVPGTAVSATGTSIDFTGIPSWVRRITVMFNNVSTNGTSNVQIQLGSGSPATSAYQGSSIASTGAGNSVALSTTGFVLLTGAATSLLCGSATFSNLTGNFWAGSLTFGQSDTARVVCCYGTINLAGVLDLVRITTVNGTDTFDAGTINILYE